MKTRSCSSLHARKPGRTLACIVVCAVCVPACDRLAHGRVDAARRRGTTVQPTPVTRVALPAPFATPSVRNPPREVTSRPADARLVAPPGFTVTPWAEGFEEPRWLAVAPNGDVFVSEHRAGRVTVLRDADGDGRPEIRRAFATGLTQPFGMAFHPSGFLYIGNTDAIVRVRYQPGQLEAEGRPETIAELPGGGYRQHWTRNVVFSPDARTMYVSVGSESNVDAERDPRRGAISAYDVDGRNHRIFASGLRNPIGMAFEPTTHELYTVVNERDELGDDLVPDYLTRVRAGEFYGWPYAYFGPHEDPRRRGERPDLVARTKVPDVPLGSHVAALGLLFYTGTQFPAEYGHDALIAEHGSWNRSVPVGYKIVRARFRNGRPTGEVTDFVTGWLHARPRVAWGRPVGLALARDGAVLVADDTGQRIWRIAYAR